MPATSAKTGMGATFSIGDGMDGGSTAYTKLGEVVNITAPSFSREAIDATHLESEGEFREFIPGLKDGEAATVSFNYVPSASDAAFAAYNKGKGDFRLTYPNGVTMDFSGIVTGWKAGDVSTSIMQGEMTVKPTGVPVFTAAP